MADYRVSVLDESTWPDFAALVERHNGVWGGCWCMGFHPEGCGGDRTAEDNRTDKLRRVRAGEAHAALVYDGERCVGWAQFGPTAELPRIKRKRAYAEGLDGSDLPNWRITCFFVDKAYRRTGVAEAALDGALREIARLGGGIVESYPEDTADRKVASTFLHNGTVTLFEKQGFARGRQLGKHHFVVSRAVG